MAQASGSPGHLLGDRGCLGLRSSCRTVTAPYGAK
jgi:hypothetical protein